MATTITATMGKDGTAAPQRIVSCSLATDEITLALLERAHHESRLIAVSRLADQKEYSNIAPVPDHVKERCGTELESLIKLRPDLVLLAPYTRVEFVRQITTAKIATFTTEKPDSLDKIAQTIENLAIEIGEQKAAQTLLDEFGTKRKTFSSLKNRVSSPRLLHVFGDGSCSGQGTMFDAIAQEVGAINVLTEQGIKGWPKLGTEQIATFRPDYIVMAGSPDDHAGILRNLRSLPGFKDLNAVKEDHLIIIPEPLLGSVSHHVLKAIELLSTKLPAPAGDNVKKGPTKSKP